jgi:hypothetical protein
LAPAKKNSLRKGGRSNQTLSIDRLSAVAIDNDSLAVTIEIAVAVALPDHDGVVAIPVVTLPDNFTIAIPIPIAVTGSDGHADRTDANSNFFRASRHREGYSGNSNGSHYKTLDHVMLLFVMNYRLGMRRGVNGSCPKCRPVYARVDRQIGI